MTYEQLQMSGLPSSESTEKKSQSYRQDSRASRTALQEKVAAIVTAVTCGARLQECSEKLNRLGSSVKIRPVYLQGKISDSSGGYSMTLPHWGIASGGEFGELVMSEPLISETECLLLPTPTASEGFAYTRIAKKDVQRCVYRQHHPELRGKISGHTKRLIEYFAFLGIPLNQIVKLQEMIMGFPKGWTDLDASETR